MLSDREKRLIELKGLVELMKEVIHDLLAKEDGLDELEQSFLEDAIVTLRGYEREVIKLTKSKN
ncbi:MAG: hypothetical protein AAGJ18_22580 [Bacteroidota bacterium]